MSQLEQETAKELADAINSVKINTERLVTKMELIYDSVERLENAIEKINETVTSQERRITILEQSVPKNLLEDVVLLKSAQAAMSKFLWLVAGVAGTTFANMIVRFILDK